MRPFRSQTRRLARFALVHVKVMKQTAEEVWAMACNNKKATESDNGSQILFAMELQILVKTGGKQ